MRLLLYLNTVGTAKMAPIILDRRRRSNIRGTPVSRYLRTNSVAATPGKTYQKTIQHFRASWEVLKILTEAEILLTLQANKNVTQRKKLPKRKRMSGEKKEVE